MRTIKINHQTKPKLSCLTLVKNSISVSVIKIFSTLKNHKIYHRILRNFCNHKTLLNKKTNTNSCAKKLKKQSIPTRNKMTVMVNVTSNLVQHSSK